MCNVSVHSIATSSLQSCTSVLSFDLSQRRNDPLKKFCSPLSENLFLRSPLVERRKFVRAAGEKFPGSSARPEAVKIKIFWAEPKKFWPLYKFFHCFLGGGQKIFNKGGRWAQLSRRCAQRNGRALKPFIIQTVTPMYISQPSGFFNNNNIQ